MAQRAAVDETNRRFPCRAQRRATSPLVAVLVSVLVGSGVSSRSARAGDRDGLLVVTPTRFRPALEAFVAHKREYTSVEMLELEPALRGVDGIDDAEKLKQVIFKCWKKGVLGYVLLVGDVDAVPVRYMVLDRKSTKAFDYAFYPSDLYYADLVKADGSFDDWNGAKDGFHRAYFGEVRGEANKEGPINFDAIDYHADVAVGRWPTSSVKEVRWIAEKTIRYERAVRSGALHGTRRVSFVAVGGWVDSRRVFDHMATYFPSQWSVEKRYYRDKGRADDGPPPDRENVVALFNRGGLIFHAGHGQTDAWDRCLNLQDLGSLTNRDCLPIVLSAGCSTAYFAPLPPYGPYVDAAGSEHRGTDHGEVFTWPPPPPGNYQREKYDGTGLGEALLCQAENGAVAYFGCNTGSQPCGLTLLRGFARAIGKGEASKLGDAWRRAVEYYYERERLAHLQPTKSWYPPSIFFQGMKFMLFGDPSLVLPLPVK